MSATFELQVLLGSRFVTSHEGSTVFGGWKLGLLDPSYMIFQMFLLESL
jgi:hypothetical protein